MHKLYHEQITRSALETVFSRQAIDIIVAANLGQDSLINLLKGHYHFDANGFEKAFAYLEELDAEFDNSITAGKVPSAWAAFGRKTHAVQDYYAHTNYVALWLEANPDVEMGAGNEIPPLVPEILQSDRLYAARVYYPFEALTLFPVFIPFLKRILPADSHVNMNLDSPEAGPLFPLALSAAKKRTRLTCEAACSRIAETFGEDALKQFLDKSIDDSYEI